MKPFLLFIGGALLFGAVTLGAGYLIWENDALVQGGTAFALAFVPAAGTLAWVIYSYRASPDLRLLASLGGSGLRMMMSLGGGFFLTNAFSDIYTTEFFYWLALFYLVLLFFEMALLVQQENKLNSPPQANLSSQSRGNG